MNRELLEKPFTPDQIRQRQGQHGHMLDYVEGHSVIQRLNDALEGNWSFEVVEHRLFSEPDEVLVLGRLSACGTTKCQFGSSTIKRARQTDRIVGMADAFKAAATDALKKCATLLGVGLDLYADGPADRPRPVKGRPRINDNGGGRVTAKQHQYLISLAKGKGWSRRQIDDHCLQAYGAGLDYIKRQQASALIEALNAGHLPAKAQPAEAGYLN